MTHTNNQIPENGQCPLEQTYDKSLKESSCFELFHAIFHDMRSSLAEISGSSLTLQENWKLLSDAEKVDNVTRINQDSDHLINLLENLLALTRMGEDNFVLHTNEELVEEVIGETLQKLEKRHPGCLLQVHIPKDYIFLSMDALLIEQTLLNLLENALLHSNGTQPVDLSVTETPEKVTFTIRYFGICLPDNMVGDSFGKFTEKSAILITCKAIIEAHQGTLTAENHRHGAEFVFSLPKPKEENL